ncbi:zinc finger MYND domain-containing protein [Phanerochaete sordida]|uniref:Zinc finger MYND domain-containing protein n=1 Tax=Phanerochaete sordida TaxID=48140 RepID=A0A9P3LFK3_9APHY|nr:zinc finger MYND domain-containing protein [Phanerochaete sordida]
MIDQLADNPERTGDELRRVHADTIFPMYRLHYTFVLESAINKLKDLEPDDREEGWDCFFESGIVQALFAAALDEQIYTKMHEDRDATTYVVNVYHCLLKMITHALNVPCGYPHATGKNALWASESIRSFPRLWSLLSQYPQLVTYGSDDQGIMILPAGTKEENEASGFRMLIAELLPTHLTLCAREGAPPPALLNDFGLVALSTYSCTAELYRTRRCLSNILIQIAATPSTDFIAFLNRATVCGALVPTRFVNIMLHSVQNEAVLDRELYEALACLDAYGFYCAAIEAVHLAKPKTPLVVLSSALRQVCNGTSENYLQDIVSKALSIVIDFKEKKRRTRPLKPIYNHYLVILTAFGLCNAATDASKRSGHPVIEKTIPVLIAQANFMNDPQCPCDTRNAFKASVRQVWHRGRDELIALPDADAPHKEQVLEWWRAFGAKCGVDLDAPYVPREPADSLREWTRDMGCAWSECLCFHVRVSHTMRRCGRCMLVWYCSEKCQSQDWDQGGHRRLCRRTSS